MDRRLSYDELHQHYRHHFEIIACRGDSQLPIFSGDLSVALRLRHRVVKDIIEQHFPVLRRIYGRSIQIVRRKRRGGCRAMRGYLMPFHAMLMILPLFEESGETLMRQPALLHMYYTGERFASKLN